MTPFSYRAATLAGVAGLLVAIMFPAAEVKAQGRIQGMPGGTMAPGMQGGVPGGIPGAGMHAMQQVQLTEEMVRNFAAVFPKLREVSDRYGARFEWDDLSGNPAAAFAAMVQSQVAMAEVTAVLNAHGFADMEEWVKVGYSTMVARAWKGDDGESPMQKLDQAIAEVRANPAFSEQQRAALIAQMEAQRGMITAFQPLPGNKEIVDGLADLIDAAMKDN